MAKDFEVSAIFEMLDKVTEPLRKMGKEVDKFSNKSTSRLGKVGKSLNRLNKSLLKVSAIGVATFSAAAFGAFEVIGKFTERADVLAKTSRMLQFPIKELQDWQFLAEQSGVSSDLFTSSLSAFTRRLGDARLGTGLMITTLKKLSPVFLKQLLAAKSMPEALELYLEKVKSIKDPAKQASLLSAGFSRAGMSMVGLIKMTDKARENLLLTQRKNGDITMKQAEAAEHYNDALNNLHRSYQGLLNYIIPVVLPTLTKVIKSFRLWIFANKDLIKIDVISTLKGIISAFKFIAKWGKTIAIVFGVLIGLNVGINILTASLVLLNVAMAANPIVLIVMAWVAAFAILFVAIYEIIKNIKLIEKEIMIGLHDALNWLINKFKLVMNGMKKEINLFVLGFHNVIAIPSRIEAAFTRMISSIEHVFKKLTSFIKPLINEFDKFFGKSAEKNVKINTEMNQKDGKVGGSVAKPLGVILPRQTSSTINKNTSTTSTTNNQSSLTIKDETGRVKKVSNAPLPSNIKLISSGAF